MSKRDRVPTVSRIDGNDIVELIYDPERRKTAFVVGHGETWECVDEFNASTGETLVPYLPTNNLIAHECVMLPSTPCDSGEQAVLLRDIECYLHRLVDFSPLFEKIAAHYILLTWVYDAFNELPYLRLKGEYGSGKTRALIALGSISYKGFFASGASTVSPIFHTLDSFAGTLILDEADLRFSDKTADLVKILNNGTVRGLPVLRTLTNKNHEFNPAAFAVFGPKIIAMRETFHDAALESRFITEEMGVRPLRPDIPIQLPDSLKVDALLLRNRLLHFRLTHRFSIECRPDRLISGIDPRLNQTVISLLSLVQEQNLREEIEAMLRDRHAVMAEHRAATAEARAVAALRDRLIGDNRDSVPLREVAQRANELAAEIDEELTPRDIGRIVRSLGIELRKSHGTIVIPKTAKEAVGARARLFGV